jgi:hypothetical protein
MESLGQLSERLPVFDATGHKFGYEALITQGPFDSSAGLLISPSGQPSVIESSDVTDSAASHSLIRAELPYEPHPALRGIVWQDDGAKANCNGKRIGILIVTYNAITTLPSVLKRITPNVWANVEEIAWPRAPRAPLMFLRIRSKSVDGMLVAFAAENLRLDGLR